MTAPAVRKDRRRLFLVDSPPACPTCRRTMTSIYVDADACPVKNEIYRVAGRYGLKVYVVSNSYLGVPRDPRIELVVVSDSFDAADNWIAERAGPGDIVVTADIPLADRSLKAGAAVIGNTGVPFRSRVFSKPQPRCSQRSASATALIGEDRRTSAVFRIAMLRLLGQRTQRASSRRRRGATASIGTMAKSQEDRKTDASSSNLRASWARSPAAELAQASR